MSRNTNTVQPLELLLPETILVLITLTVWLVLVLALVLPMLVQIWMERPRPS